MNIKSHISKIGFFNDRIGELRTELLTNISEVVKHNKIPIDLDESESRPIVYFEGSSIFVEVIDENSFSGTDENGVSFDIDLGEAGTDDLIAIYEIAVRFHLDKNKIKS
jgi:hypothetical protein